MAVTALMTEVALIEPRPRRWTREEFYRLAEQGLFQGQRAELIEGEIMVLSPQKWYHARTVDQVAEVLRAARPGAWWVRSQLPLNLSPLSDPEPDVSVVAGRRTDYTDHPTTALLIVEVSDTSLAFDREYKGSLYARVGIADYWIVNLVDRQLEVYRQPVSDLQQPYGHRYAETVILKDPALVRPLTAPAVALAVADLVPPETEAQP
jgi:Uma2 family endonuclease